MTRVVLRPLKAVVAVEIDWPELINQLLPDELPRRHELCKAVLKSTFQRDLPEGVLQAASTLVALELEVEARALLADFFLERRGASRIGRRLEMQRIFQKRRDAIAEKTPSTFLPPPLITPAAVSEEPDGEAGFGWSPVSEEGMPSCDDADLRHLAGNMQLKVSETAEEYRTDYEGKTIAGWDDPAGWANPARSDATANTPHPMWDGSNLESQLLDRLAALGNDGVGLLRYFHINPGDGAKHAADVLDYQVSDVNHQLNNKLKGYVQRHESGWACVDWVSRMLELMPK